MRLQTSISDLELRELSTEDAESLHQLIQINRSHLTQFGDYTDLVELSAADLLREIETGSGPLQFGIIYGGALIGTVSLIKYQPTVFGLGYWIATNRSGRGYATEAVRSVIDFAIDECGATEIWAGITPTNEPSIRLVLRLGFSLVRTQETHLSYQLLVQRGGT